MGALKLYVIADDQNLHGTRRPLQSLRIRVRRRRWRGGMMTAWRGIEIAPGLFVSRHAYDTLFLCRAWWIVEASRLYGAYSAVAKREGGSVNLYRRAYSMFDSDGRVLAHKGINEWRRPR